jgi:hypothetical protein
VSRATSTAAATKETPAQNLDVTIGEGGEAPPPSQEGGKLKEDGATTARIDEAKDTKPPGQQARQQVKVRVASKARTHGRIVMRPRQDYSTRWGYASDSSSFLHAVAPLKMAPASG